MRRTLSSTLLVALACAACAAPAAAAGAPLPHDVSGLVRKLAGPPGGGGQRTPFEMEMTLPGPDGYEAEVFGLGRAVGLVVGRSYSSGISAASYIVRGTVSRGRLQARFGNLGSVSMRFQPAARRRPPDPPRCKGHSRFLHRRGLYTGRLRFRGEGGYVSLDTRRAKGRITELDPRCNRAREASSPAARASSTRTRIGPEHSFLETGWKHGVSSASFLAIEDEPHKADFIVNTETSRGGMAVRRIALFPGLHGVVKTDDALTSGRVTAPAPFHGAGTYSAAPDGTKTWKGRLSVDLPGEPHVPLTGPQFDEVEMGRASGLELLFLLFESL
jgi:hypothetical protein